VYIVYRINGDVKQQVTELVFVLMKHCNQRIVKHVSMIQLIHQAEKDAILSIKADVGIQRIFVWRHIHRGLYIAVPILTENHMRATIVLLIRDRVA
jgi:hypothetical protein